MDTSIAIAIITGLFGLVSGVILAYLGAILKFRKDLEAEYDKDLRNRRIEAYKDLWERLQLLARYDRPAQLTPGSLRSLSVSMRKWYFEVGGIYLSEETRKTYFDLKGAIHMLVVNNRDHLDKNLETPELEPLLEMASLLRSSLTRDVGTRKTDPIADS